MCHIKDGAGSVAGFVIRFQDKTAGNLHCSFSCEAPGSLSSRPAHSAALTPASPSPAAWQTTQVLTMQVSSHKREFLMCCEKGLTKPETLGKALLRRTAVGEME